MKKLFDFKKRFLNDFLKELFNPGENLVNTVRKLTLIIVLILLFIQSCKEKKEIESKATPPQEKQIQVMDQVLIGRMNTTSSTSPLGLFEPERFWKSENELDGITLFFNRSEEIMNPGKITETEEFDEISLECRGKESASVQVFKDGKSLGVIFCSEPGKFLIPTPTTHSLFLQPNQKDLEITSLKFFRKGGEMKVIYPEALQGQISASSTRKPEESYPPSQLFDGSIDFGWVEGAEDDGIGEWVSIELDQEIQLTGLEIFNGYQRLNELFQKNGALTGLTVSDGKDSETLKIADKQGGQRVFLTKPLSGKSFRFTIESVRTGSKWKDTVISELILLGEGKKRFWVNDPSVSQRESNVRKKIKNSHLENLVNRAFKNELDLGRLDYIFRSNGSFVIWYDEEETKRVYDGNWVIKKLDSDSAEIFLFGRDHKVIEFISREESTYGENREEVNTLMFRDNLKIETDSEGKISLKGEKLNLPFPPM